MRVHKSETLKSSHNCFTALAGYMANMIESKDHVIEMFRKEIKRKNELVGDLLLRQEQLENQLARLQQVMEYDQDGTPTQPRGEDAQESAPKDEEEKTAAPVIKKQVRSATLTDE